LIPAFFSLRRIGGRRRYVGVLRVTSSTAIATVFPREQNDSSPDVPIGFRNAFWSSRVGEVDVLISFGVIIPLTRLSSIVNLIFDFPYGMLIRITYTTRESGEAG
jgi:hypothetical protein